MEIEDFDNLLEELVTKLSKLRGRIISRELVFNSLVIMFGDEFEIDHPVELWGHPLSKCKAYEILKEFDFDGLEKPIEVDLEFERDQLFQTKVKIKAAGFQLVIHRYDKDPFPSDPHAHIIGQNLKIDLKNGDCYRSRKFLKRIKRKELLEIREKSKMSFKGILPALEV